MIGRISCNAKQLQSRQRFAFSTVQLCPQSAFPGSRPRLMRKETSVSLLRIASCCHRHFLFKKKSIKGRPELRLISTKSSPCNEIPALFRPKLELLTSAEEDLSLTRPPVFDNPADPPPNAAGKVDFRERTRYLYLLGKAYLAFYKRALKQVWACFKNSRKYSSVSDKDIRSIEKCDLSASVVEEATQRARLWNNVQFIRRSRHDVRKMLPFGLMLIICGEFTPVITLAWRSLGSWLIPAACKIPLQIAQEHKSVLSRLRQYEKLPLEVRPEFGRELEEYTNSQVCAKTDLFGESMKPKALAHLLPTNWLIWIYKMRLASWRRQNLAEVSLLPLDSLQDLPSEEIVRLCFLVGFIGPSERRALDHLVRHTETRGDVVTDFVLDMSKVNLEKVRHLLKGQIQNLRSSKYLGR